MAGTCRTFGNICSHRGSKLLAVLHTPLVERVDSPNNSLAEDFVFVKSDQLAQGAGSQTREQNGVARSVAVKHFLRSDESNISRGQS